MKTSLLTLFTFLLVTSSTYLSASDIWIHNYDQALTIAKKQNKNVYLFIGADICKFCKKYKEQTLSKANVMKRLTKDYVPVYLSRDQHFIPKKYEKYGVPRHYFLDSTGKIFFDTRGLLEEEGFYTMLDEAELSQE